MKQKICAFILYKLLRWRRIGDLPTVDKYLFVAVPHTSNWDFFYGWLAIQAEQLEVTVFAKDTFYRWPLNYVCDFFGVAPINRRERTNFVDALVEQYERADKLATLITPEGTRGRVETLKSGYYYIAKKADVPIVVAGPDYPSKSFELLPARPVMDTFEEDCAAIIAYSKTKNARHPANAI